MASDDLYRQRYVSGSMPFIVQGGGLLAHAVQQLRITSGGDGWPPPFWLGLAWLCRKGEDILLQF